jgi:hypothetical protein
MSRALKILALQDSERQQNPAIAALLFLWELFLVTSLCGLFIIFIGAVQKDVDIRSHYSLYLFHLVFPPLLFGIVTWATRAFRPGRMFISTLLAAVILSALFPFSRIAASLWVLGACLVVAFCFQLYKNPPPPRKYRLSGPKDPVEEDPELKQRMASKRRIDRSHGSHRQYSRPIPTDRFWPHSRL